MHQGSRLTIVTAAIAALCACGGSATSPKNEDAPITSPHGQGIALPPAGRLYHGVFPGDDPTLTDPEPEEDRVTPATVDGYETTVGRKVAWVYFSHNWYRSRVFPAATATWIRGRGALPFIRLMLRSSSEQSIAEPTFTLERIVAGDFDADLTAWGQAAARFGSPLIVEWGTEVNGSWFSWNGTWNGGAAAGPTRFRHAYRHIVRTISAAGAAKVTWVFHVAAEDVPQEAWNRFEEYYPGDDAVDWVGVSIYGAETPLDTSWTDFRTALDSITTRFSSVAPGKPIFVLEFGASAGTATGNVPSWTDAALTDLLGGRWSAVRGFSWWNERWGNDSDPAHDTDMRVQSVPGLAAVFQARLASAAVVDAPILSP